VRAELPSVLLPSRLARGRSPRYFECGLEFHFIIRLKREQGHTAELHPKGHEEDIEMRRRMMTVAMWLLLVLIVAGGSPLSGTERDPLPSWNDGASKKAIIDFVDRVTRDGGPDYVKPEDRVATFDHDGTLWAEQPMYFQIAFAMDRVRALAPKHPDWKTKQPFKAVLDRDIKALAALGETGFVKIMAVTHSGITTDDFSKIVADWIATARHPRFDRPYTELVYQPMLELLGYLRANGFKTFIVSGGGIEFMRVFTERVYGIPPEQVVGSSGVVTYQLRSGAKPVLVKNGKIEFVDDGPGKPVGINRFIGKRPVFAFGNSDGDQQMLEWTAAGTGARFMGLVHHTDAEREWAYDRKSDVGRLNKAWDEAVRRGWTVTNMKTEWKRVFAFEP
jgi:phosphoglycolate phosphatase-like HAD superfamily hydrolase